MTSDPIGLDGGVNEYTYVVNNPLYWVDPEGLWAAIARPLGGMAIRRFGGKGAAAAINKWGRKAAGPLGGAALCFLIGACSTPDDGSDKPNSGPPPISGSSGEYCEVPPNSYNEGDEGEDIDPMDDFPADPDDWTPPEGWREEPKTRERTKGRHRHWYDETGKLRRRWDREGDPVRQPSKGPHWWDSEQGNHIKPTR